MKCLHIQLKPAMCHGNAEEYVKALTAAASDSVANAEVNIERGDDDGPYINVNIDTLDINGLWSAVSSLIATTPQLASAAIVCCEGDKGWDDYLLLHHFDSSETVDRLP